MRSYHDRLVGRLPAVEGAVDQDSAAAATIAVEREAIRTSDHLGDCLVGRSTLESRVSLPEDDPLHPTIVWQEEEASRS